MWVRIPPEARCNGNAEGYALRYARDFITSVLGAASVITQIIIQIQGGKVSAEMLVMGITLLTMQPFLKLGDKRADAAFEKGRHEVGAVQGSDIDSDGRHDHNINGGIF